MDIIFHLHHQQIKSYSIVFYIYAPFAKYDLIHHLLLRKCDWRCAGVSARVASANGGGCNIRHGLLQQERGGGRFAESTKRGDHCRRLSKALKVRPKGRQLSCNSQMFKKATYTAKSVFKYVSLRLFSLFISKYITCLFSRLIFPGSYNRTSLRYVFQ